MDKIRMFSRLLRYGVIGAGVAIGLAVGAALLTGGQDWLAIGDEKLAGLLQAGMISEAAAVSVLAPIGVIFVLGVYWLQRLFGHYAAGNFFTEQTMICYLWLVWLKAASFVYQMLMPLIINALFTPSGGGDPAVIVDAGSLVELILMLLIVSILREAQRINQENESFV